jgi:serine/threonine-protein kinase
MSLLQEGHRIGDTYEVERFLGEGAFAEVYRVKHRFLGRQAMKVFKAPGMTQEEIVTSLGEAVLLSRLGHPNIIRVFDASVLEARGGKYGYFTMEYVAGGSLDQFWRSFGPRFMPVATVIELTRQICRGLAIAHAEKPPIVHRDIKPQNVLVGYEADGLRVRISDFGLAKRANPLTLLVSAKGTLCFKAPEAFEDYKSDSCAGDVWAVGTTMYLLLTDRFPFAMPETGDIDPRCFQQAPIPPSRLNALVDTALDQLVLRCVQTNPKQRYPDATAVLSEVERWAAGTHDRPVTKPTSADTSKAALGAHSPANEELARAKAKAAFKLARETGRLNEAADLLEEALNKSPSVRSEYESQVKLWRRGILM